MIISIIFWAACGLTCAVWAEKKGKNPYLWFLVGLFFSVAGVVIAYFKLRRKTPINPAKKQPDRFPLSENYGKTRLWFIIEKNNEVSNSMSFYALKKKFDEKLIDESTYVWMEALPDWQRLGTVETTS